MMQREKREDQNDVPARAYVARRPLQDGVSVIQQTLKTLGDLPGCYQMIDAQDRPLYIGKARILRRRVASYAQVSRLNARLKRVVSETVRIETIVTQNEAEALLLEANLIRRLKPRYNILLRDDKTLPSIKMNINHDFPRLMKSRGAHDTQHTYFGPFASANAVNTAVATLQKVFRLRECSDHVFAATKRPCILYELKRCSAPCVGRISKENYAGQVALARSFFSGRNLKIQRSLGKEMEQAAQDQNYELAAEYRDRLVAFGMLKADQGIYDSNLLEADVLYLHLDGGKAAITQLIWRAGSFCGLRTLFPRLGDETDRSTIIGALIGQLYTRHPPPRRIIVSDLPEDALRLEELLGERVKVRIMLPRGKRHNDLMQRAKQHAEEAAANRVINQEVWLQDWVRLEQFMQTKHSIQLVEIYDNSHLQGRFPVSAKVVADRKGWRPDLYRMYYPRSNHAGDDVAMMHETLTRRLKRLKQEDQRGADKPDLIILDGGRAQRNLARKLLDEMGIEGISLIAVAKGEGRRSGLETIYREGMAPASLSQENEGLFYFLLRLRDEAHRFVIGRHRARRSKAMHQSALGAIEDVGIKRRTSLLRHFGSIKNIANASVEDIAKVDGINRVLAKRIQAHLRS